MPPVPVMLKVPPLIVVLPAYVLLPVSVVFAAEEDVTAPAPVIAPLTTMGAPVPPPDALSKATVAPDTVVIPPLNVTVDPLAE